MAKLTLTGLDARTDVGGIKKLISDFENIEFGILRSPKVGMSPRYPVASAIRGITSYVYPQNLAFHLCGRYARMVHSLEWGELCDIIDFDLVGRVQVNSTECDDKALITLQRFSAHIDKPVVMQWRGDRFPAVPVLQVLQDRSGGQGIEEETWIGPDPLCRRFSSFIGYAGGLNPSNIAAALPNIKKAAGGLPFWIDCESGIRTDDWLDLDKCRQMAEVVCTPRRRQA